VHSLLEAKEFLALEVVVLILKACHQTFQFNLTAKAIQAKKKMLFPFFHNVF